jgi:uncharacterized delta-60 repeat protein
MYTQKRMARTILFFDIFFVNCCFEKALNPLYYMFKSFIYFIALYTTFQTVGFCQDIDTSFDPKFLHQGNGYAVAVQSDGKIIVGGNFNFFNGVSAGHLARLNADGTIDNSFNPGSGADAPIYALLNLPGGKILVGGDFTTFNGIARKKIARLNANGSLDNSFSFTADITSGIYTMALQTDGKIIVHGRSFNENKYYLMRLNEDGSNDTSFSGLTSTTSTSITKIAIQPDGKILVAGSFSDYKGNAGYSNLIRLESTGALDNTFKPVINNILYDVRILTDGKLLASSYNNIVRLNANGTADNSFSAPVVALAQSFVVQSDNSIIIGNVNKLSANGSLITSTNIPSNVNVILCSQPDNKILAVVENRAEKKSIIRLNADLTVDPSFQTSFALKNYYQTSISDGDTDILKDGSGYLVKTSAAFYSQGPISTLVACSNLIRLNGDFGFVQNITLPADVYQVRSLFFTDDVGKIFLSATVVQSIPGGGSSYTSGLVKLNADGSHDPSFTTVFKNITDLKRQADGKLIALEQTSTGGAVIRLNADGSIDPSFSATAPLTLRKAGIQSDGKVVVCAENWTPNFAVNGSPAKCIFRLNTNGTLDASFQPAITESSTVNNFRILLDNNILAAGIMNLSNQQAPIALFGPTGSATGPSQNFLAGKGGLNVLKAGDIIYLVYYDLSLNTFVVQGLNSNLSFNDRLKKISYYQNNPTANGTRLTDFTDHLETMNDGSILIAGFNDLIKFKLPTSAPSSPTTLSLAANEFPKVTLTWKDNSSNESGFEIQRSVGGTFSTFKTTEADVTLYKDSLLNYNTLYTYRLRAVNFAGESTYSNEVTTLVTGTEDSAENIFTVFPNPTNGLVKINLTNPGQVKEISLLNLMGQNLKQMRPEGPTVELDLRDYPAGLFLLKLSGPGKTFTQKIIKK